MKEDLNKISRRITQPRAQGASQAMLYATGLTESDMDKPQVGISSVWYEGNSCNMHLNDLAAKVKQVIVLSHDAPFLKLIWDELVPGDVKTLQLARLGHRLLQLQLDLHDGRQFRPGPRLDADLSVANDHLIAVDQKVNDGRGGGTRRPWRQSLKMPCALVTLDN